MSVKYNVRVTYLNGEEETYLGRDIVRYSEEFFCLTKGWEECRIKRDQIFKMSLEAYND